MISRGPLNSGPFLCRGFGPGRNVAFGVESARRDSIQPSCSPAMTEETPEVPEEKKPEEKVAKKAAKKKAARKRTAKPKEEKEASEGATADAKTEATKEAKAADEPKSESAAPASSDQDAAVEKSSDSEVRRISNKPGEETVETVRDRKGGKARKVAKEEAVGDDAPEGPPVISEPPASEDGGNKRRRRRRRKGGQGEDGEEQSRAPRPKLDPELVAKKAWKIYLAEVSEEGLALISDQDARELSRRSFRLAEVFLEEAARHQ